MNLKVLNKYHLKTLPPTIVTKAGLVCEPISRNLVRAAAGEEATVAARGLAAGESTSRAAVPFTRCALAAGGGVASNTSSSSDSLQKGNVNTKMIWFRTRLGLRLLRR